jgi:hypothetical protein
MASIPDREVRNLKIGDIVYECQYGTNIRTEIKTTPEESVGVDEKPAWKWTAVNTVTGETINYMLTEGLGHYGPRLYNVPMYATIREGEKPYFELLGGGREPL